MGRRGIRWEHQTLRKWSHRVSGSLKIILVKTQKCWQEIQIWKGNIDSWIIIWRLWGYVNYCEISNNKILICKFVKYHNDMRRYEIWWGDENVFIEWLHFSRLVLPWNWDCQLRLGESGSALEILLKLSSAVKMLKPTPKSIQHSNKNCEDFVRERILRLEFYIGNSFETLQAGSKAQIKASSFPLSRWRNPNYRSSKGTAGT